MVRKAVRDFAAHHGVNLGRDAAHIVNRVLDEAIGLPVKTFAVQKAVELQRRREEHLAFVAHDVPGGEEWGRRLLNGCPTTGTHVSVPAESIPKRIPKVMAPGSLQVGSDKAKLRLLLVDDEPTVRGVIREWLEEDGHYVETADDGIQGLERYKDGAWDVVITDRMMPRLDGDGLANAIKEIDPLVPIILVTAFADRPERGVSPFDMIIRKPLNHDTMRAAIASSRRTDTELRGNFEDEGKALVMF